MAFANYAVSNAYRGRLVESGALGGEPVPYRLVVSGREPALAGIVDRAIGQLHPAELDAIRRRWSLGEHPETLWERRRPQIELGAALGFHLLFWIALFPAALLTGVVTFAILALQRLALRAFEAVIVAFIEALRL